MDFSQEFETLCNLLSEQIADHTRKIKNGGMSSSDLDALEKLTHTLASVKKIMAFMEDDEGYSGNWPEGGYRESYRGSYNRGSYARKRDRMGRYSGGYSRGDLADKMRQLMMDAPDDRTRQEMQRLLDKLEE